MGVRNVEQNKHQLLQRIASNHTFTNLQYILYCSVQVNKNLKNRQFSSLLTFIGTANFLELLANLDRQLVLLRHNL